MVDVTNSEVRSLNFFNDNVIGSGSNFTALSISFLFLVDVLAFASFRFANAETGLLVIGAAVVGAYMALNIGANDVANNVGAAVGSRALTLGGAILIAGIFEAAGALLAGGDVVSTISKGIIDPSLMPDTQTFVLVMVSALLAGGLWLNLATRIGAPVSTTHSIVGGVLGAGVMAAGFGVVDWGVMSKIAASWFVSPILGGVVAAGFLILVEVTIIAQDNKINAARRWVPVLLGILAAAFTTYLIMKGFKKVWRPDTWVLLACAAASFTATYALVEPLVARASRSLENHRRGVNQLFTIPLICSAALLSFAHGANDVANAVGPLSAIVSTVGSGSIASKVEIPFWVMATGAMGLVIGLALFGPKLIRVVGRQVTSLDRTRAFCVCLSAAMTVIAASALGLPVSSTHIAVGAIFGVGFYRECRANSKRSKVAAARKATSRHQVDRLNRPNEFNPKRRVLVRRIHLMTIVTAWLVTVPAAAVLAASILVCLQFAMAG